MTTDPDFVPDPIDSEDDAAGVVRAVLSLDDIAGGSVLFLLCDGDRRPVLPIVVSEVPPTAPPVETLEHWLVHLGIGSDSHDRNMAFMAMGFNPRSLHRERRKPTTATARRYEFQSTLPT